MSLHMICDGGITTAEYLWNVGVRPTDLTFFIRDVEDDLMYCDDEDTILFVIHGCTSMDMTEVLDILDLIANAKDGVKDCVIMSDIPLDTKRVTLEYCYYEGDIMCGKFTQCVTNNSKRTKLKESPLRKLVDFNITEDDVTIIPHTKKCIIPPRDIVNPESILNIDLFRR